MLCSNLESLSFLYIFFAGSQTIFSIFFYFVSFVCVCFFLLVFSNRSSDFSASVSSLDSGCLLGVGGGGGFVFFSDVFSTVLLAD